MAQYKAIISTDTTDTTDLPSGSPQQDILPEETTPGLPDRYEAFREADIVSLTHADAVSEPAVVKVARVQNASVESQPPGSSPWNKYPKHHWWHKTGLLGLFTVITGTLVILVSCGILVFLWKGAQTDRDCGGPAKFWKTIVFRGMVTKVITICSAAIRVSVGLHISLVAAAVAALILETTGTRFRDIAAVSIQRASGSSAYTIIPASLRVARLLRLLRPRYCSQTWRTSISLDLCRQSLFQLDSDRILPPICEWCPPLRSTGLVPLQFGEMKPGNVVSTAEIAVIGNTYRALLPCMKEETRTTLEDYSGPGLVGNFRTVCFSPSLERIRFGLTASRSGLQAELDIGPATNQLERKRRFFLATLAR
ncbi:hypothetical protein FDENT_4727 [Fusarium denticulatum]|uniref:Uncharacterized protein n=1 Tax=Fusarium denticulatum TaxID=48507 RepID=A0A8H5UKB3_9HYPO|nr:hypothetical protein FDENT_4727 [Fusarium denticulatum]